MDMAMRTGNLLAIRRSTTHEPYIIAARVKGQLTTTDDLYLKDVADDEKSAGDGDAASMAATNDDATKKDEAEEDALAGKEPQKTDIDVILVADIDWIAPEIFRVREMGQNPDWVIDFKLQNVPFVLNILDSLAGDDRFIDLRKRARPHRTLTNIEEATEDYRTKSLNDQAEFMKVARQQIEAAENDFRTKISELENRKDLDPRVLMQMLARERIRLEQKRDVQIAALEKDRNRQVKQSERELSAQIRGVQDRYKLLAVLLPPIPPILLAFFVFFHRRKAEQEGVDTRRLRYGRVPEEAAALSRK
jgi:ABC-2 type transport system permease protein